jgi:hypothetical protein
MEIGICLKKKGATRNCHVCTPCCICNCIIFPGMLIGVHVAHYMDTIQHSSPFILCKLQNGSASGSPDINPSVLTGLLHIFIVEERPMSKELHF